MIVDLLRAVLNDQGGDVVRVDPDLLDAARSDKSGLAEPGSPACIVEARSVDDVRKVLRTCFEQGVAVVPRGAGTGLASGASGTDGSVVLTLAAMTQILEIDAENELAVVEPGVLNADLNRAVAAHGLRFAPDPASAAISTVGGNIATNAGGLRCIKYGVTRDAVLGLDVVLADGRLIRTGHRTVKGVTGYDLTALFVGSEGTLGVVVGATVRLVPIPVGVVASVGAVFPDVGSAAAAASAVTMTGRKPATLELLDAASVAAIGRLLGPEAVRATMGVVGDGAAFLLTQFDGPGAADDALGVVATLQSAGGHVRLASDAAEGERLVAIRRAFHPAMEHQGRVLIEDVAVPRSRLAEMFSEIARIGEQYGVSIPTVAHAGDGNLHPNFVFHGDSVPDSVWAAASEMFRTAIRLGGTLTGEHGVGVLKARWLRDELGDDEYELQLGIKKLFDPTGILNPGKVFA
jgi:glycolate oxidase